MVLNSNYFTFDWSNTFDLWVGNGEITVGLIIFIPFIISSSLFGFLGITCIVFSMLSIFFILQQQVWNQFYKPDQNRFDNKMNKYFFQKNSKIKGVIFLGPIPIVFGSDKKISYSIIIVSIILIFILVFSYASLFLNE